MKTWATWTVGLVLIFLLHGFGAFVSTAFSAVVASPIPGFAVTPVPSAVAASAGASLPGALGGLIQLVKFVYANWLAIIGAITMILHGLIGIAMLFPGAEPEKTLQKIVDVVERFSAKKGSNPGNPPESST